MKYRQRGAPADQQPEHEHGKTDQALPTVGGGAALQGVAARDAGQPGPKLCAGIRSQVCQLATDAPVTPLAFMSIQVGVCRELGNQGKKV